MRRSADDALHQALSALSADRDTETAIACIGALGYRTIDLQPRKQQGSSNPKAGPADGRSTHAQPTVFYYPAVRSGRRSAHRSKVRLEHRRVIASPTQLHQHRYRRQSHGCDLASRSYRSSPCDNWPSSLLKDKASNGLYSPDSFAGVGREPFGNCPVN